MRQRLFDSPRSAKYINSGSMSLANFTGNMDETFQYIYKEVVEQYVPSYLLDIGYTPWVFSLLGSALIGLSGILPLFVIPNIGDGKEDAFNRK